ncbi:type II toxin-antitoxin system antitoxin SocA domain-containing protein [Alistipes sp. ZOR0009]|uniref:type II toxin-antitoxin system antitoxin SocA domain-containing protein n=1 Tax=Alistipes sp. ZOR0009 TaxID=1339253 RepID=UPI0006483A15|nr:type II toxin-antitoxin system antitoxin SocA domain-containing protein [Alistipes sp. ZOR0009]
MKSPFTGKEMPIVKEWRTLTFRKEEFRILAHFYKCEDTGEQLEDGILAELNYNQAVNQYREKYNIPFPEQISAVREKYDVSASKMSDILGFGANVYRQYEAGEVPNQSNAKLIQLVENPHEFRKLVNLCSTLEQKIKDKINQRVEVLLDNDKTHKHQRQLERYFLEACAPSSYTGYKVPDLRKFTEMVVFFSERLEPWKTKLNKLLFYADFEMYRKSGFSISGVQYRAIPMGPVPNNYDSIFEYLTKNQEVYINYKYFTDGGTGEQFTLTKNRQFKNELFTQVELAVLESVASRFKEVTTQDIIEISHREKAWLDNQDERKLISYQYGFELNEA